MSDQSKPSLPIDVLLKANQPSASRFNLVAVLATVAFLLALAALAAAFLVNGDAATEQPTIEPTQVVELAANVGIINSDNSILRAEATQDAAIVAILDQGTSVILEERLEDSSWYKVSYTSLNHDGDSLPAIVGWIEARQLTHGSQAGQIAVFQVPSPPIPTEIPIPPTPNFEVVLYQQNTTAVAYVGSDPLKIVIQSPNLENVGQTVKLVIEGNGSWTLPSGTETSTETTVTLDENAAATQDFYAVAPISNVTIYAKVPASDGTDIQATTLSFTTRQEFLTLDVSPDPTTNPLETIETPIFFNIALSSNDTSTSPRNYHVNLELIGDTVDAIQLVQRNPNYIELPPDEENPERPFIPLQGNNRNTISIPMQPGATNSTYGIILVNKVDPPFTGSNRLMVRVGTVEQDFDFTWTVPCIITNPSTIDRIMITRDPATNDGFMHLDEQLSVSALGILETRDYYLVNLEEGAVVASDTQGWLPAEDVSVSPSCEALPLLDAEGNPIAVDTAEQSNQQQ